MSATIINSLEECKDYFIETQKPEYTKHINNFYGKAKYENPPGRIGVLLKKYFNNIFGIEDIRYYWLVFRKDGWFNGWASPRFADKPRFRNKPGCSISSRIYSNMLMENKFKNLGALVIGFGDGSFHYVKCVDFIKFTDKYNTQFEDPRFGDIEIGLVSEITNMLDPFKVNN